MERDSKTDVQVRAYRAQDKLAVIELLKTTFGTRGWPADPELTDRAVEYFEWKHESGPWNPSLMFVAEAEGRLVGFRAWILWHFLVGERRIRAARGMDAAVHPAHQRTGISHRISLAAEAARERFDDPVAFGFGTPNDKSLPGALKRGRKIVGGFPFSVLVRGAAPRRGIESNADLPDEALADEQALSRLLEEARSPKPRFETAREVAYLRWRYPASFGYRAVREERGGRLAGLAIFRTGRVPHGYAQTSIVEMLVASGDARTARRLVQSVMEADSGDWLVCCFPDGSAAADAAASVGFRTEPEGMNLVVSPAPEGLRPNPEELDSWALTLGDLEHLV